MSVSTAIDAAQDRVRGEQAAMEAKVEAIDSFIDRVADLPPASTPTTTQGVVSTAGAQHRTSASTTGGCEAVRTAFAETIRPHSVADVDESEPLLETIRNELSDTLAVALAPPSNTPFSEPLKRGILREAGHRRTEMEVARRALDRELAFLEDASVTVDEITGWIATVNETPLLELGFDALRSRHETLATHRERCGELAADRQSFLRKTTGQAVETRLRYRNLIPYLYREFPTEYPVLVTVSRLDTTCRECQRTVRNHLTRRV